MKQDKETFSKPDAALIYCRVSSKKQEDEGSGLDSQEHRCRERALQLGCDVEAIFPDTITGEGDFMKRPGMVALLAYLEAQTEKTPKKTYVVIFDDLKRFARDVEFYRKLRRLLKQRGALVDCLNFKIEDTPEGKFIETIIAAQGELEREQNGRQVLQKMKARVEQGFWVFRAPKGYKYTDANGGGKELVTDEPLASIVTEAFEGYACGRLESQAEVRRYLQSEPEFPKNKSGEVLQQRVAELLTQPIYAGYLTHKRWGIHWLKARHAPLVSLETYEKVQERRKGMAKAPARKNLNEDFPMRGFVLCNDCQNPLTSCWSKGKRKQYPYYLCDTRGCDSYRKSIRREVIEGEFADIVRSLQPARDLIELARTMFKQAWNQRTAQAEARITTLSQEARANEKRIEELLERILSASNATVIAAYEGKIETLEHQNRIIADKLQNSVVPSNRFEEIIEHSLQFLANPWNLWACGHYHMKRLVLRLAFSEPIAYCRNEGYRTPKTSLPFKVLESVRAGKSDLVRVEGLEPPRLAAPEPKSGVSANFTTPADCHFRAIQAP